MGPIRGKVGPIVGYTWKGQCVIRSLPKKISKAPSQKQLDNRKKMAVFREWHYWAKQHGFGNALSYLKLNAMNEDLQVDPEKLWSPGVIFRSPYLRQ